MSLDSRRLHSRRERFPNEQAADLETKSERNQPRVETDKIALCLFAIALSGVSCSGGNWINCRDSARRRELLHAFVVPGRRQWRRDNNQRE